MSTYATRVTDGNKLGKHGQKAAVENRALEGRRPNLNLTSTKE